MRDAFLVRHPECAACGGAVRLQVHHVVPFHVVPSRELDPMNLIVLCMGPEACHLDLGHGGSFASYNPHIRGDAEEFREDAARERVRLEAAIKARRIT